MIDDFSDLPFGPASAAVEPAPEPAPAPRGDSLLAGLNPKQREAVETTEGPLLVVAGAGTGKTRVLTTRIARILDLGLARPDEILAVTFTNKAASEMKERVVDLVGEQARELTMGSFHSVSMRMLRQHAEDAGLDDERFDVVDEDDQRALMGTVMDQLGIQPEGGGSGPKGAKKIWTRQVKQTHQLITSFKEEGWTPARAAKNFAPDEAWQERAIEIYHAYAEALRRRNLCDFADLILHMVQLFRHHPAVKAHWAERFKYVLVDEFQDTNPLQYEWLQHLARACDNLCVVGDPDQAVYEWRSARPQILIDFAKDWPGARTVVLETNYRSTQPILDVANKVVADNPRPAPKTLESGRDGEAVRYAEYDHHYQEAEQTAAEIAERVRDGQSPAEIAVLFRSARPMLAFEQKLQAHGVPYAVVGGMKFYQREEVKDALCYLRLMIDTRHEMAFRRIANKPNRAIGDKTAEQVLNALYAGAGDVVEACREVAQNGHRITAQAREGLEALAAAIEDGNRALADAATPGAALQWMIDRVGYVAWRKDVLQDESWRDREDNLRELVNDLDGYDSASEYLQQAALLAAADSASDEERVRLSTIHAAKGLEFETVFTPAFEEGVLPNATSLRESYGLHEERRIAHVAWTRAKRDLIVTRALSRHGQPAEPSRFLLDAGLIGGGRRRDSAPMPKPQADRMRQAERDARRAAPAGGGFSKANPAPGSYYARKQAQEAAEPSRSAGIPVHGFHKLPRRPRG